MSGTCPVQLRYPNAAGSSVSQLAFEDGRKASFINLLTFYHRCEPWGPGNLSWVRPLLPDLHTLTHSHSTMKMTLRRPGKIPSSPLAIFQGHFLLFVILLLQFICNVILLFAFLFKSPLNSPLFSGLSYQCEGT